MLRNVALTAPYGHNGAYATLQGIIRHHLAPKEAFDRWRPEQANLPDAPWLGAIDFVVWQDEREIARLKNQLDIAPVTLTDAEIAALEAFLHALTGTTANNLPLGVPKTVPSGLSVDQ